MSDERPIFYDSSGKRWWHLKSWFLLLACIFSFAIGDIVNKTADPVTLSREQSATGASENIEQDSPADLAYKINHSLPIIGKGAFVRIVKLQNINGQKAAVDVYSGKVSEDLSAEEISAAGNEPYAIEKYGHKGTKHLILTFDDGPDPVFTPQVLDVLSEYSAHSSFFVIAKNVAKYPEIANRIIKEGHDIANHTFSHADLDLENHFFARQEINQAQHIIRANTGVNPTLFRIPYGGNDDASLRDDRRAILEAQQLGYTVSSYDIDSDDWEFKDNNFKIPEFDGSDKVILLHDGGGNRALTIEYLRVLLDTAKKQGYEFTSLSRLYEEYARPGTVQSDFYDQATNFAALAIFVWPKNLMWGLFVVSVALVFISLIISIILAEYYTRKHKPRRRHNHFTPKVSVIIPAYNEEKVLARTIRSLLRSFYRNIEILVVDDGSKDNTWEIARSFKHNKMVKAFKQENFGKAVAINKAISKSKGEVIVTIDADTIFTRSTISKLVRHFYYEKVGAVAGVVKVGNIKNWITKWQALEYVTAINVERAAQAFLHAIVVAPGACSAWRKEAILKVGGYSNATLAEDCDLTLSIRKSGYSVVQDMEALAYTESPETVKGLFRQRYRWLFGNIQSYWKHSDMFFRKRYGWLGLYVLPKAVLGIVIQLVCTPILLFVMMMNLMSGELIMPLVYIFISNLIIFFTAIIALNLAKEKYRYLTATPAFRLMYSPLRTFLLYASVIAAIGGIKMEWNKLSRTGTFLK